MCFVPVLKRAIWNSRRVLSSEGFEQGLSLGPAFLHHGFEHVVEKGRERFIRERVCICEGRGRADLAANPPNLREHELPGLERRGEEHLRDVDRRVGLELNGGHHCDERHVGGGAQQIRIHLFEQVTNPFRRSTGGEGQHGELPRQRREVVIVGQVGEPFGAVSRQVEQGGDFRKEPEVRLCQGVFSNQREELLPGHPLVKPGDEPLHLFGRGRGPL
jgi:hypothetical protein